MSSPARSWSERTTATASKNCSRNAEVRSASLNRCPRVLPVYQVGRGQDPVTVVGRSLSLVAVYIAAPPATEYILSGRSIHSPGRTTTRAQKAQEEGCRRERRDLPRRPLGADQPLHPRGQERPPRVRLRSDRRREGRKDRRR